MKQRVRVVGIIKGSEGVLIFKRNRGRSEAPVFWELPTGKIKFGEQPEEAMARALTEYTGLTATQVKLKDVVTFMAPVGSSQQSNLYIVYELNISNSEKPTPRDRYTAYKYVKEFVGTGVRLDETSATVLQIEEAKVNGRTPFTGVAGTEETNNGTPSDADAIRHNANSVTINVDGASRGNPGPSGIGYCIHDETGKSVEQGGEFIGFATSRLAEYLAMRKGIERAIELGYKSVRFVSDNLMVVNQLNGVFQVKNQDILPVYKDIQEKLGNFETLAFVHNPREENTCADKQANLAIDKLLKK